MAACPRRSSARCAPSSRRCCAASAADRRPRRQADRPRRCSTSGPRPHRAHARHQARRVPARSGRHAVRPAPSCSGATPGPSWRAGRRCPRASSTSGGTIEPHPARRSPSASRCRSSSGPLAESLRGATASTRLNDEVEVPLVRVLARMEHLGIGVDVEVLTELNDSLTAEAESERAAIIEAAGDARPRTSTSTPRPQMRAILFDKLGLTPGKKTKTGYSTDQATLEKLRGEHPIIEHLLRYREVEKLRSTYGEGLLAEVAADGRIHATFNQTVARTGRLSSDAPNLHNIPVRSDEGRRFREAFVPAPGRRVLWSPTTTRSSCGCIAHLAEDPGLIEAFTLRRRTSTTRTASRVFGVAPDEVTIEQRSKAKMVSYGLAYGMESYGLGQRLSIPTERGAGDPRRLLRGLPQREGVHGAHGRRGPRPWLHRDGVRPAPPASPSSVRPAEHAHGGGASGHERADPGPGGRHLQGRARPPGRAAHRAGLDSRAHPAGPRRGHARGARR